MTDTTLSTKQTLRIRAAANKWISDNFPTRRRFLSHSVPTEWDGGWRVGLLAREGKNSVELAALATDGESTTLINDTPEAVAKRLDAYLKRKREIPTAHRTPRIGEFYEFCFGDGIAASAAMADKSIDLLLTDPPYGISDSYTCENQVPRRLRKNGADFIMPRGHFGSWDDTFPEPAEWTVKVLPKVRGWAIIFCAQAQIGEYTALLKQGKFVAVGTLVWQKTNPVPFNHAFKPINAWEAIVVGKRPGAKFNGRMVHNVFVRKSPSPQTRIHPTQKPVSLIADFIKLFSDEGDLIVDPFAGSATTIVAAATLGRRVLAFENDAACFDAAAKRLGDMSTFF